jgi:hypothetical protein
MAPAEDDHLHVRRVSGRPLHERPPLFDHWAEIYLLLEFLGKKREKLELPAESTSCGWGVPYESAEQELAALERPRVPH